MSNNSSDPRDRGIDSNQQANKEATQSMRPESTGYHYVKYHGYAYEDFAEKGEIKQYNGIRILDESASGESEEFENFKELNRSEWKINGASGARLSDGTILFEGRQ